MQYAHTEFIRQQKKEMASRNQPVGNLCGDWPCPGTPCWLPCSRAKIEVYVLQLATQCPLPWDQKVVPPIYLATWFVNSSSARLLHARRGSTRLDITQKVLGTCRRLGWAPVLALGFGLALGLALALALACAWTGPSMAGPALDMNPLRDWNKMDCRQNIKILYIQWDKCQW